MQEEHLRVVSQLVNRHQMQIEDLNGQLLRMQQNMLLLNASSSKPFAANFLDQLEKINGRTSGGALQPSASPRVSKLGGGPQVPASSMT